MGLAPRPSTNNTNPTSILSTPPQDINDNAPVFSQQHYDAVLLADGTFHQPLVVSATDLDEPSSANSQVAYEIIAGNQNDQFAIDSLSGTIYPVNSKQAPTAVKIPSMLAEPIVPFNSRPDQAGKILPSGHEVEESTGAPPGGAATNQNQPLRLKGWPKTVPPPGAVGERNEPALAVGERTGRVSAPQLDLEQLPRLDLLLNMESRAELGAPPGTGQAPGGDGHGQQQARDLGPALAHFDPLKVAPVTTLVVRAHDFGIPLRSSTCKVIIHNQALQARTISVILNGTAEQLEPRRDAIERAFGSLTGSRASIDSIEALSESSSISVARVRLTAAQQHGLVDLTDLSALMGAIDYRPPAGQADAQHQFRPAGSAPVTHYIAAGDRLYPASPVGHHHQAANVSGPGPGAGAPPELYTDIHSFAMDSSALERKLLIYIIIVGVCILALLVIWMIYSCSREDHVK